MRSIDDYMDPGSCPAQPPPRAIMHKATQALHQRVDDNARRLGEPSLRDVGESVTFDLFSTRNIAAWQERKSDAVFSGEIAWSTLLPIYGRYGLRDVQSLGDAVASYYGAGHALMTCSGMTAVSAVMESFLEPRRKVILLGEVYNKTRSLLEQMSQRMGCTLASVPYNDLDGLRSELNEMTDLVFVETFTNPHVRALYLDGVRAAMAGASRALLVVDDTIATPWGPCEPLLRKGGADIVVGSGTKALSGDDSALSGYIVSARADLLNACMNTLAMRGGILDQRTARELLGGLPDAKARHAGRCASAEKVASFLQAHPRVAEVFHPSLATHPDRAVVASDYARCGSLLSFRLSDRDEAASEVVCDALAMTNVFRYALSFDGLVSKVNHHRSVSEYFTPEEVLRAADLDSLIRLGIGAEHVDDLLGCLNWALWHGPSQSQEARAQWESERRAELGLSPSFSPDKDG